jgi:hypothetical protein
MGKKITQYNAVSNTNPDTGSLIDISEKSGSTYATKKWSLLQLKTWLTTYLTLPFASLTSTPTTLVGYGITDAIDGSGTANYLSKFSDSNTLANSLLQDNGSTLGLGTTPIGTALLKMSTSSINNGVEIANSKSAGQGIYVQVSGASSIGAEFQSIATSGSNVGFKANATGVGATTNTGAEFLASGGSSNYALRLRDGSEATGKFLKSINSNGQSNWAFLPTQIQLAVSDETTALTTGTSKITFRMPYAMTLTEVRASLSTAQTSGSILTIDINESGSSVISTKLTIDNTEKTSTTATTPAVISDSALADDAEITIDIDQVGDGTAKGLKITLIGTRA